MWCDLAVEWRRLAVGPPLVVVALERSLAISPHGRTWCTLAEVLLAAGKLDGAEAVARAAISVDEGRNVLYPATLVLLARVYLQRGVPSSALDILRRLHDQLAGANVTYPFATAMYAVAILRTGQLALLDVVDLSVLPARLVALIREAESVVRYAQRPVDDTAILDVIRAQQREMRQILVGLSANRMRQKVAYAKSAGLRIEGG